MAGPEGGIKKRDKLDDNLRMQTFSNPIQFFDTASDLF